MKPFPPEAHPFILAASIAVAFFIAAMVRVWLLRRTEARLLKTKEDLEKQLAEQEREVVAIRSDSQAWRAEMTREFDGFRAMASEQLRVEQRRFDDLLTRSEKRQAELQSELDLARQMCVELPSAKARVMHLEEKLGVQAGAAASAGAEPCKVQSAPASNAEPRREWNLPQQSQLPAVPSVQEERTNEAERSWAQG